MNNLEPTAMNGTLITDLIDLIDMVQERLGIDLESLGAKRARNLVPGSTFAIARPPRGMPQIPAHIFEAAVPSSPRVL
jgi:hypothetical protein